MEFLELAKARYSERSFEKSHPIEEEKLSKILEAGRMPAKRDITPANKMPASSPLR